MTSKRYNLSKSTKTTWGEDEPALSETQEYFLGRWYISISHYIVSI